MQLVRHVNRSTTPAEMSAAIAVARERPGEMGTTVTVGDGLEWRYDAGMTRGVISMNPEADGTVVRIIVCADGRQFILYFGAAFAVALTGFIASSTPTPTFNVVAAGLAIVPYFAAARFWWNRSQRAARTKLVALAVELARQLE